MGFVRGSRRIQCRQGLLQVPLRGSRRQELQAEAWTPSEKVSLSFAATPLIVEVYRIRFFKLGLFRLGFIIGSPCYFSAWAKQSNPALPALPALRGGGGGGGGPVSPTKIPPNSRVSLFNQPKIDLNLGSSSRELRISWYQLFL